MRYATDAELGQVGNRGGMCEGIGEGMGEGMGAPTAEAEGGRMGNEIQE